LATLETKENAYNLSIQRYLRKGNEGETFDPVALKIQYQSIISDLTETGKRIQARLDDLGFGNNN